MKSSRLSLHRECCGGFTPPPRTWRHNSAATRPRLRRCEEIHGRKKRFHAKTQSPRRPQRKQMSFPWRPFAALRLCPRCFGFFTPSFARGEVIPPRTAENRRPQETDSMTEPRLWDFTASSPAGLPWRARTLPDSHVSRDCEGAAGALRTPGEV